MNDLSSLFSSSCDLSHLQSYLQAGKSGQPMLRPDSLNEILRLLDISDRELEDMLQNHLPE